MDRRGSTGLPLARLVVAREHPITCMSVHRCEYNHVLHFFEEIFQMPWGHPIFLYLGA